MAAQSRQSTNLVRETTGLSAATGNSMSVDLVLAVSGSPFYEAMACGATAEAKQLGVALKVSAPSQFSPVQQLPILNAAISSHPSAIVLVPTDAKALNSSLHVAERAGIKIVTTDEALSSLAGISSEILSNNSAGGALIGDEMARELPRGGQVLLLTTEPGQVTSQDDRANGFLKEIKKYPRLHYVGAQYSNDEPSLTSSQVSEELTRYPNLAGIFADNDQSGIGAASALVKAGKSNGKVKLFVYDSAISEVQSLRANTIQGLVAQEPRVEGVDGVMYAVHAVEGKTVPKIVETPTKLLTRSTPVSVDTAYEYQGTC